jgi:hypothetical protein
MNRQMGAFVSTLGEKKTVVMAERARDVNPDVRLRVIDDAIDETNVGTLLDGADLFVDGLDLFAMDARRLVFAECASRNIPALTVGPLGMGAAQMVFVPGGTGFEAYFRLEGRDPDEQVLRFLVGLAPASLQRGYLVEPSALDLASRRAPSTPMACAIASGIAGTTALCLLLDRGGVKPAPWSLQYDAYRQRLVHRHRPLGNANPLQRITLSMARRAVFSRRALPSS